MMAVISNDEDYPGNQCRDQKVKFLSTMGYVHCIEYTMARVKAADITRDRHNADSAIHEKKSLGVDVFENNVKYHRQAFQINTVAKAMRGKRKKIGQGASSKNCGRNFFQKSETSCKKILSEVVKCMLTVMIFSLVFLLFDCSLVLNNFEPEIAIIDVSDRVINEMKIALYGQHIVIESLETKFHDALTDDTVQMVTLFLIGPTGSGKTLTRKKIQTVVQTSQFSLAIFNKEKEDALDLDEVCGSHEFSRYLAVVIEMVDDDIHSALHMRELIFGSRNCSRYKKVLIIIASTMFSNEINEYMFSQCKFKNERLSIKPGDIISYISRRQDHVWFERSDSNFQRVITLIFLPLDIDQVSRCSLRELSFTDIPEEKHERITRDVIKEIDFHPHCGKRFSESGCKLVKSRVDYVINKQPSTEL